MEKKTPTLRPQTADKKPMRTNLSYDFMPVGTAIFLNQANASLYRVQKTWKKRKYQHTYYLRNFRSWLVGELEMLIIVGAQVLAIGNSQASICGLWLELVVVQ